MLQRIKTLLTDKIGIIAILVTICIFCLSLAKLPKYDVPIVHADKWQHSFAYFTLSFCWLFTFYKKNRKFLVVCCCILFGIIIEVLQHNLTNYRTGDYFDILANSFGVLLGLLLFNLLFKRKID